MKIYITRWALTEGVLVADLDDAYVKVLDNGTIEISRMRGRYDSEGQPDDEYAPAFIVADEWARTEEEARAQVAALATKKAETLRRRAARIERLAKRAEKVAQGLPVRVKDAGKSQRWSDWGLA